MFPEYSPKFVWLVISGLCGSLIGLGMAKELDTPLKKVIYLFGGVCSAFFLAGPIAKYFGLTDPGEIASVGFVVSIFWQQIMVKLSTTIQKFKVPGTGEE